jgi:hypothetical protein
MLGGRTLQPPAHDLLLSTGQSPWPPRYWPGAQDSPALLLKLTAPPAHAPDINPEEVSDFLRRIPFQQALDCQNPPVFQFGW